MTQANPHIGSPQSRVDGRAKVTGAAKYAAEFNVPDLTHGYVVSSTITRGKIAAIDTAAALAVPGVLAVFTHENRPPAAGGDSEYQDAVAPPGSPFRPLYDDDVRYAGQPIALVVADTFDTARYAATLVRTTYESIPHATDVQAVRGQAYVPLKKRSGVAPPPSARGTADSAYADAPVHVEHDYVVGFEHHNPMEPHASTVVWHQDGSLTIHDKTQGVQNSQTYVAAVFGMKESEIRVVTPFVGGAFGSGLRPQYQLFLAVMAARALKRSVRVELTRAQMFSFGYRPGTLQTIAIGADRQGHLQALRHAAVQGTSHFEDYQEVVVNWSGLLYDCANVAYDYRLAKIDTYTPSDMRAPGATTGVFALECAMDELAHATGVDPLELRLRNYADKDENDGKPFTSKELRACYLKGAERFGWSKRSAAPRSMRAGRELIGWGMATGVWEAFMMKTAARATLRDDGTLEVATATSDIGTGTYTILAQIGADALGLSIAQVTTAIGDSDLPTSPVEGGSWTAASAGAAVQEACYGVRETLLQLARGLDHSPLRNASLDHVTFADGAMFVTNDPARRLRYADVMRAAGRTTIVEEANAGPDASIKKRYSSYTHSAVFAEVRVDEDLGVVRCTRIVDAVAAGRILNPKTARSQILGGVVFGIGMALHEETLTDHRLGRFMNRNLAEYHLPSNADVRDIDVIFVDEHDDKVSPLGVKGLGEIGIVGTAAAIANAVFHATGTRVRDLPITLDKLLV